MAETKIELEIKWENNKVFQVLARENGGEIKIVVKAEENGDLTTLWSAFTDVMERYIKTLMARIGKEMASS